MGGRPGGRQGRGMAVAVTLIALSAQLFCASAARHSTSGLRRLAQAGTNTVVTSGNAAANSGNNNFVGAAQQALNNPNNAQNANLAAKQLVTSATGNQQVNSNDLNSLIQGVRLTQTFSQYLQSLGGASTKQTSLHSTMDNENIAGLYKQQQNDDQFKVGSPSGSVYWTAGNEPVPAPAQAVVNNFVTAVAPSLSDVTNSLIALIPSPPPPPPPPTVIQALAPIEEDVSNRISSFLTESGNNAKSGTGNTNGQASSFQQQALPTVSVPTTFTHEAYSGDGASGNAAGGTLAGRKLKQSQAPYAPQQQQQWAPAANSQQQQAQWSPAPQQQQQQWAPATNSQQQAQWSPAPQQQQQWTPASSTQQQQWTAPAPPQWVPSSGSGQQQQQYSPQPQQQQQWAPNSQSQQTFGATNDNRQQSATPQYTGATSQTTQNSGIQDAQQWPSSNMVQLSDGRWVPSTPTPQQAPPAAQTTAAPGTGTGQASPYTARSYSGSAASSSTGQQQQQQPQYAGASSSNTGQQQQPQYAGASSSQGVQSTQAASAPAPAPANKSPAAWTFPPVTVNGVNLPGWSLPKWTPGPPAPPLGPAPAMSIPQAPRPLPLPATLPAAAQAPGSSSVASFQSLTNTQGQPLTKSLAEASALPQLQQIGANTGSNAGSSAGNAAQQQPARLQTMASAPGQQPGPGALPGFPAQGPALPNNNLMWVNVGGQNSG